MSGKTPLRASFHPEHAVPAHRELQLFRVEEIHYTALHQQGFYREHFGYQRGDLPNAEWVSDRTVSLPLSPAMTDEDAEDVIAAVIDIIDAHRR